MNIPNMISLARIAMVPPFFLLYRAGNIRGALLVLLLNGVSDLLDGFIARRFNMVTDLGKIIDPVADKLFQAAMMLCAANREPMVWLLLGLHILRESLLSVTGIYVIRRTGRVESAKWYGKLCSSVIYVSMTAILALPKLPAHTVSVLVLVCTLLVSFCLCMYLAEYIRSLERKKRQS